MKVVIAENRNKRSDTSEKLRGQLTGEYPRAESHCANGWGAESQAIRGGLHRLPNTSTPRRDQVMTRSWREIIQAPALSRCSTGPHGMSDDTTARRQSESHYRCECYLQQRSSPSASLLDKASFSSVPGKCFCCAAWLGYIFICVDRLCRRVPSPRRCRLCRCCRMRWNLVLLG